LIFFDIDETILDHLGAETSASQKFAAMFGGDIGLTGGAFLDKWHELAEKNLNRYLAGEVSYPEQRRSRIHELFGADIPDAEADRMFGVYLENYEQSWTLFPDVIPCLDDLGGERIGIISNGDYGQQHKKLVRMGILERFEVMIISGQLGFAKPDPRIFTAACKEASLPPEECVYIGDRLETDALGASAAGLRGVWLDRKNQNAAPTGVTVLRDLKNLRHALLT